MCLAIDLPVKKLNVTKFVDGSNFNYEIFGVKKFYIDYDDNCLRARFMDTIYDMEKSPYGILLRSDLNNQKIQVNHIDIMCKGRKITHKTLRLDLFAQSLGMHFTYKFNNSFIDNLFNIKKNKNYRNLQEKTLPVFCFTDDIQLLNNKDIIADLLYIPTPEVLKKFLISRYKNKNKEIKNILKEFKIVYNKLLKGCE